MGHFAMTFFIALFNFTVVSSNFSAIFLSVTQDEPSKDEHCIETVLPTDTVYNFCRKMNTGALRKAV